MRLLFWLVLLCPGLVLAQQVRVAVIGDFGTDTSTEAAVANMVKHGFRPETIVTTGDNIYFNTPDYDRAVGKYYADFIGNYRGSYGSGSSVNRFFPAIGNHDYFDNNCNAYLNYFTLPGNERYYSFVRGDVGFFVLNSDSREPDGISSTSRQAMWLSNAMQTVVTQWKIVVLHHPPYSSAHPDTRLRWPFAQWGAHAVIGGHAHNYERIHQDGIVYVINGAGGAGLAAFGNPMPGSQFRYAANHGAMLISGDASRLKFDFYSISSTNAPLDSYSLTNRNLPTGEIPQLMFSRSGNQIVLRWATNHTGYTLMGSTGVQGPNWGAVSHTVEGNLNTARTSITGSARYFRLRKP